MAKDLVKGVLLFPGSMIDIHFLLSLLLEFDVHWVEGYNQIVLGSYGLEVSLLLLFGKQWSDPNHYLYVRLFVFYYILFHYNF
jgi:hypothetical protein